MHTEYRHSLARANADNAVRAIVVTGEGRAFCVGADAQALTGHVARGGYDSGTDDAIARPGYGVRPEFDATFATTSASTSRSSPRSTDPRRARARLG